MKHFLEILPEYYDAVVSGNKRFEIREKRDRIFSVNDILCLQCAGKRDIVVKVRYLTEYGMIPDYVCMSIEVLKW